MSATSNQFSLPGGASKKRLPAARPHCATKLLPLLLLLTLPATVEAQFFYTITNGTVTITGYYGSSTEVTTPSKISGLPVTSIGNSAFTNRTDLIGITISNSVTSMSIGDNAFYGCRSLTTATIGTNVTSIGGQAFQNCTNLTNLTIGNSVTNIGDHAFYYCIHLTSLTIGTNVTNIGGYAFSCCFCSSPTCITIPNSVISVGKDAFDHCFALTNLTIGNSVVSIGDYAFNTCAGLAACRNKHVLKCTCCFCWPIRMLFACERIISTVLRSAPNSPKNKTYWIAWRAMKIAFWPSCGKWTCPLPITKPNVLSAC